MTTMIKIGDVFKIPLSNGRQAYGQYVFKDKMGPMIRVYYVVSEEELEIGQLSGAELLFPPVITGLFAAIKSGLWKKIGHIAVKDFEYPNFVTTHYDEKTGKAGLWFLWNGERYLRIGTELPEKYQKLEYLIVWSPYDVMHRIETGEYPFPYADLIKHNKFEPRRT